MLSTASVAEVAALVGDPARATMLAALMDGRALTAAELARVAGITPQTASGHLRKMLMAGLLVMERQGRHRYHRLGSAEIARMLESIMVVAAHRDHANNGGRKTASMVGPRAIALRQARTCYDHLAGQLAVAMADRMVALGYLAFSPEGGALTKEGAGFLCDLGVPHDFETKGSRRAFCRPCLDWSERRFHIAGSVGAALCQACFAQGWISRIEGSRAVSVTPSGHMALRQAFGSGIVE